LIKIYLDSDVYRNLKNPAHKGLLDKVLAAKNFAMFFFSEAHLYDLNQDQTTAKFEDMKFMEKIASSHCYTFTDRTVLIDRTPAQYYADYDWSHILDFNDESDPYIGMITGLFKAMPLDFNTILTGIQWPANMPEGMKKPLTEPLTMYDFMMAMLDLSDNLTKNQLEFKELLRFLHDNSLLGNIYEGMGIEGFNGNEVTDRDTFYNSYAQKFIAKGQEKNRYELFTDMYHGLEFYGFVKGKPKKQNS